MGSPAYPTRWGAWRDIGVGSGLALIPLVTGPLPSPQKVNLKRCAAPPFISPGPSHLSSDVGLFVLTMSRGSWLIADDGRHTKKTSVAFGVLRIYGIGLLLLPKFRHTYGFRP